jgi:hypothetical protein
VGNVVSNFSDFIGGSGGGGLPVNIVLGHSQTWVPPVDGNICIHVVGAGGSGGGWQDRVKSGGAGGYCKKNSLAVTTSGSFTVVVGAGATGGRGGDGANGGNTTVAGTGLSATLTANGGGGASGSGANHGTGGTAANGDVNNTGGAGNEYGGGAVGITGTGNVGGGFETTLFGGSCDVVGPESLMGHGHICGGKGGDAFYSFSASQASYANPSFPSNGNGGFLAGGGAYTMRNSGSLGFCHAGGGGIGGGGAGCRNGASSAYATGGRGGDGIVIIQYLPA